MADAAQELEWAERDLKAAQENARKAHEALQTAEQMVTEQHRRRELAKRAIAAEIPVDRTQRTLTDGSPVTDDHRELKSRQHAKGLREQAQAISTGEPQ